MPGCAVHLLMASKVLARWRDDQVGAPFPADDGPCRGAFFAGCMGPDMGYYPGCNILLAELAHYLQAADLTRHLILLARENRARAFAWGWATHFLADALIHPVINRAVGAAVPGSGGASLTYADDPVNHARVETGVDAYYARNYDVPRRLSRSPVFNRRGLEFVAGAYEATYGIRIDRDEILKSHRTAARFIPWLFAYERAVGVGPYGAACHDIQLIRPTLPRVVSGMIAWLLPKKSVTSGLLSPMAPPRWLVDEVDAVINSFASRFLEYSGAGLEKLPQFNLDTGVVEDGDTRYPPAMEALRALEKMRTTPRPP